MAPLSRKIADVTVSPHSVLLAWGHSAKVDCPEAMVWPSEYTEKVTSMHLRVQTGSLLRAQPAELRRVLSHPWCPG